LNYSPMRITEDIWELDLGATVIDPKGVSFKSWAPERDDVSDPPFRHTILVFLPTMGITPGITPKRGS
jgi:hypothetical protein